jgi:hypothetical protein
MTVILIHKLKLIDKNNTKIFIKEIINEYLSYYNYKEYNSDILGLEKIHLI